MILGHAHPPIVEAVHAGAPPAAPPTARRAPPRWSWPSAWSRLMPAVEKVRFVSSGTEATMSALRVARGFTGRRKILKFDGCYHGHADGLLVAAGSGVATLGIPGSPGVPEGTVADTLVVPFNDVAALEAVFAAHGPGPRGGDRRAGVRQHGLRGPARRATSQALRAITRDAGAVLIFDEVMTGFRLALGRRAAALRDRRPT